MILDRIKFSKEYLTPNGNEWASIEGQLIPGDDITESFLKAREELDKQYKKAYPGAAAVVIDRSDPKAVLLHDLKNCKDIGSLATYKLLVKGDPELKSLYNQKHTELNGKKKVKLP